VVLLRLNPSFPVAPAVLASCSVLAAAAPLGAATVEAKRSFDLPRGDAATTLRQFAATAGRSLVFVTDKVRGETTNAVRGDFTPREALERMLAGSALEAAQDAATGALVVSRKRVAEATPRTGEVGPVSEPQPKPTPKTHPMKSPRTLFAAVAGWLAASTAVDAQTPAPAGEVVKLSAFEVSSAAPNRYQASDVTSGGRLRTAIFDSPQAISVVPEALLKDVGAIRTIDALKYISGVTESTLPNGLDRVTVRGFQWDGQTVDGFYSNSYNNLDPFLLDRIEVVKGPNAIISPSGNPGGTVNHVTKKPLFVSPRHSVRFEYGAFDAGSVEFDSTGRLGDAKSKFAYRLLVAYRDYDAYYDKTGTQRHTISPSLSYQLAPNTKITVQAEFLKWKAGTYLGFPIDPSAGSTNEARMLAGVSPTTAFYNDDVYRTDRRTSFQAFLTSELTEHLSVRLAARQVNYAMRTYQLNFASTNGDGGARDPNTGRYVPFTVFGPGPAFAPSPAAVQNRTFNQTGSTADIIEKRQNFQNDWVYERTVAGVKSTTSAGFAYTRRLPDADASVFVVGSEGVPINMDRVVLGQYRSTGVTLDKFDILELTRQYYLNQSVTAFDGRAIFSAGVSKIESRNGTKQLLSGRTSSTINSDATTVNYGVVVKPAPNVSLFYGHAENASPIASSISPPGTPAFSEGIQDEFGGRVRLMENRLQLSVTYFKISQNAFSVTNPGNLVSPPPNPRLPNVFSDRVAKGWELEGTFEIQKGLTVIGHYTAFTNRDPFNVPFRGTAEKSAAAWARYEFQSSALKGFSVSAGANWLDKRPGDIGSGVTAASTPTRLIPNLPSFYLPARTLVDLSASYTRGAWTYQANIDNVFDQEYILASISRMLVVPGSGINLRASVTYRF
jgi:iron complex outermembrane receptor protein